MLRPRHRRSRAGYRPRGSHLVLFRLRSLAARALYFPSPLLDGSASGASGKWLPGDGQSLPAACLRIWETRLFSVISLGMVLGQLWFAASLRRGRNGPVS
jgi:hypothetical protein